MSEQNFKHGDRVRIVYYPDEGVAGMTGTIVQVPRTGGQYYSVKTDDPLPWGATTEEDDYILLTEADEMEVL